MTHLTRRPGRRPSGFTLLELLVVLLIIGLLAGYVGPKYFSQIDNANVTAARAQITAFDKALDQYRVDVGAFPTTAQGLASLVTQPSGVAKWNGPYLKKDIPLDPWGHAYAYTSPGTVSPTHDYEIVSNGPTGQAGGTGKNAPVTSY